MTTTHKSSLAKKLLVEKLRTKERKVTTLGTRESLNWKIQKSKGKIESKDLQSNMHLKYESENMSEAAQQTEEKELQP